MLDLLRLRAYRNMRFVLLIHLVLLIAVGIVTLDTPGAATLPPVAAKVTRVQAPAGTRAHGTPLRTATAPLPTTQSLARLFRLPTPTQPVLGRSHNVTFTSAALGRSIDYWIYLPPNYNASDQRYPVLYMLHGLHGNSRMWKDLGLFDQADMLIRQKKIAPLIIVTPQGDDGYWMNHADGGPRWADYIISDLIPHVDTTYRTLSDSRYRAIGGLSMGGHGAIQLALNYPGMFAAVGGHSAVFRTESEAFPFFGTGTGYQQRDPVSLVQQGKPVSFALWLDMGASDPWMPRTQLFNELLSERGVPHVWRVYLGGHDPSYWTSHLPVYLKWYDQMLRLGAPSSP